MGTTAFDRELLAPSGRAKPLPAGALLTLVPRDVDSGAVTPPRPRKSLRDEKPAFVISYGGREFATRSEMAEVFLKRLRRVIDAGVPELVPLLHEGGIELLLISRAVAIGVRPIVDDDS